MSTHPNLQTWVEQALRSRQQAWSLELVAGDASPRRYYRLTLADAGSGSELAMNGSPGDALDGVNGAGESLYGSSSQVSLAALSESALTAASYIAVDAPATEKTPEFLAINQLLSHSGVRVPAVYAHDLKQGFMLLEDLGDKTLLPLLTESAVGRWYEKALDILRQTSAINTESINLEFYDAGKLRTELNVFAEWFVPQLLELAWDNAAENVFGELCSALTDRALMQPQCFVHRDYHSRNLMVIGDELAVIDFQDAVIGPITYDLVSLLKDCYIRWPRERQLQWLEVHRQRLVYAGILTTEDSQAFVMDFDLMGLQRHIKVLGVFARLSLRDNKHGYLNDLPLVLAYVREAMALYAETLPSVGAFRAWFESVVVPACQLQRWYQELVDE